MDQLYTLAIAVLFILMILYLIADVSCIKQTKTTEDNFVGHRRIRDDLGGDHHRYSHGVLSQIV
jgi:hypothetical protein